MGIFDAFKNILSNIGSDDHLVMRQYLCTSEIADDINRNDIVRQLIEHALANTSVNISLMPYHPSAMEKLGTVETLLNAATADKFKIDLAICTKTKILFYNGSSIKSLVDSYDITRRDNDWETFIEIMYGCGLKLAIVDPARDMIVPFQKK